VYLLPLCHNLHILRHVALDIVALLVLRAETTHVVHVREERDFDTRVVVFARVRIFPPQVLPQTQHALVVVDPRESPPHEKNDRIHFLHTHMGLDIEPLRADGEEETKAFWPGQHLHYVWSHFNGIMRVIAHNAVLTGVAKDAQDPTVTLITKVDTCDKWTTEQCRDVHVLIRKTFNASTYGPDPQTTVAKTAHVKEVKAFQEQIASMFGVVKQEDEEDSMVVDDDEDNSRLKRPTDVSFHCCSNLDAEVLEFGETMAVFYANGWGAGFY
jgi:hypothetical protein